MFSGLLLCFIVGILWTCVGVFYKMMAQWKLSVFDISLVTCPCTLILTILFYTKTGAFLSGELPLPDWTYVIYMIVAGGVNMGGCLILQRSMLYGKSAVTWAIGQSALIIPFLAITLIFAEPWSGLKILGTLAILAGMIAFSGRNEAKDEALPRARYGLILALISFAVLGIAQTMLSGASYLSYKDPGRIRPILALIGSLSAVCIGKIALKKRGFHLERKAWLLICLVLIQNALVTCIQFVAMDHLAACRMNAVFFPFAIGVCIGGYALCSVIFFKEKTTKLIRIGILLILTGILMFCLSAASGSSPSGTKSDKKKEVTYLNSIQDCSNQRRKMRS